MMRLAHLHPGHPIKNFARVEIAKEPALKLKKKWRMNRITEIEQRVWSGQSFEQTPLRHADALHCVEIVRVGCGLLIQQAISVAEAMFAQASLETFDPMSIFDYICGRRQKLQPDCVQFQPAQAKHPLQRDGKNAAAFGIFCCKPAPKKNRHPTRIARVLNTSSILPGFDLDASARQSPEDG
jgi:hypothetical protein